MIFSARHLPDGLHLDPQTGRITGMLNKEGEYIVKLSAKNKCGTAKQLFKIVCGPQIGLTPAMGWNSWNSFARARQRGQSQGGGGRDGCQRPDQSRVDLHQH